MIDIIQSYDPETGETYSVKVDRSLQRKLVLTLLGLE